MTKLERFTRQHASTVEELRDILATVGEDGRLEAAAQQEYDGLDAKRKQLAAAMKREAEIEAAELAAVAVRTFDPANPDLPAGLQRPGQKRGGRTFAEMFGAPQPGPFKSGEEFFRTVHSGLSDPRLMAVAGQNEAEGARGGFSVPEELAAQMLDASLEDEIVRPRASIEPMKSKTKKIWSFDASTSAGAVLYGGFTPEWIPEEGEFTPQRLKLKTMTLTAYKLALLGVASNEVIDDGGSFEGGLQTAMTKALGWGLDDSFLNGLGAGTPIGALKASSRITVAKETGQLADTIVFENLSKMWARLHPALHKGAVWVANSTAIPQLQTITVATGTAGVLYPAMNESNGRFFIFGAEVLFTEKVPAVGDEGDIALVNWSQYAVGLRKEVSIDKSIHPGFTTDQSYYRGIIRADGGPRWGSVYTPKTGSTLSWCVVLAARA